MKINTVEQQLNNLLSSELKKYKCKVGIKIYSFYRTFENAKEGKYKFGEITKQICAMGKYDGRYIQFSNNKNSNETNDLIEIYLNHYKENIKNNDIYNIVFSAYHELRHFFQSNGIDMSPKLKFIYNIELAVENYNNMFYEKFHREFLSEIDANCYATKKTNEFFNNKECTIYNIDDLIDNYNFNLIFDEFLKLIPAIKKHLSEKDLEFLINKNGKAACIDEIKSHEKYEKLDFDVQNLILNYFEEQKKLKR